MTTERLTAEEILKPFRLFPNEEGEQIVCYEDALRCMKAHARQEVEAEIEKRMPTEEEVVVYFNNHFNCYADTEGVEGAMTNIAVLKLINWFSSRMKGEVHE